MSENLRVIRFAVIVCLACSVVVSSAALGLRERQDANLLLDIRKNILKSVGLFDATMTPDQVNTLFEQQMEGLVLGADGEVIEGRDPMSVDSDREPELRRLYKVEEDGKTVAYAFPIQGQGLWSTVYGYFALEADLNTVKGITFYKHGETPGLGGEVEKDWFQDQFVGKQIRRDGELASVTVVKGGAAEKYPDPEDLKYYVDGISGATITADGVTKMIRSALEDFEPYFNSVRQGRSS
ncbi:MAG: NADH:ubiquinone reductase (Na(+)-transporting) subunit C [Gemmatimonadetes bacterium]|nr:NADH:ubiquinone reductase (Na(+)-transporting) subunit C [Gemmatimonadota bacterium]